MSEDPREEKRVVTETEETVVPSAPTRTEVEETETTRTETTRPAD